MVIELSVTEIRQMEAVLMAGQEALGKKRVALQEDGFEEDAFFYCCCEVLAGRILRELSFEERALRNLAGDRCE